MYAHANKCLFKKKGKIETTEGITAISSHLCAINRINRKIKRGMKVIGLGLEKVFQSLPSTQN